MRTKPFRGTPLVGHKPWFGPKRAGWGLGPIWYEGWAVILVFVVVMACLPILTHMIWPDYLVAVALLIVISLKSTSMGGPREWKEYQAQKNRRDDGHGLRT